MHGTDENPIPDPEDGPEAPAPTPIGAFLERHRFVLGITLAVVFAAGTAVALVSLRPDAALPGFFGVVQRFAFPLMTALIAAVGLTWALRLPRRWPNLAAYLAIGTYLLYLATGWIHEQFLS
ncbi:hypothetical protein [Pseudactinotalea sp. HY158]|uniref:hypothetical protein n=1 Tax=Pseudactinotalea sp. HY158 TaxID=2654547 RepID=UPI00129C5D7C|nr:hypothetical protein [Pseudactinotalea sp. HY158]QGH68927.1 hypothetical protein GCE65_04975 [Pseudactinotalea sp. HY158]